LWHPFKFGVPPGTGTVARRGLHDEVLEVRRFAASFFVSYPAAEAVPDLTEALADPDASVRADAASALAKLGPAATEALPQLKAALADLVPRVRACAAQAYLAAGGDPALAFAAFEQLISTPEADDRRCTGVILGEVAATHPDRVLPLVA